MDNIRRLEVLGRGPGMGAGDRLRFAMSILQANQSMVNFTDSKANSLLLINSIFLATGTQAALDSVLSVLAVSLPALAILLCGLVIRSRLPRPAQRDRARLVFFAHIRQRTHRAAYLEDFQAASPEEITESLAEQIYELARVVERKFSTCQLAQLATLASAAGWLANLAA